MAFGIPILHRIINEQARLSDKHQEENKLNSGEAVGDDAGTEVTSEPRQESGSSHGKGPDVKPLVALIMTPTRELAIQIKTHLQLAAKYTSVKVSTTCNLFKLYFSLQCFVFLF